jgi:hypothetical protein
VRRIIQWTIVPVAVMAVACGKSSTTSSTAMNDDLKQDLKLASQTQSMKINPDEVSPESRQVAVVRPKAAVSGPRVIRTSHPTVKASAAPSEVAEIEANVPQVQVMASAPAPAESPDAAPPLARPSSSPSPSYPGTQTIPVSNGGGTGGGNGGGGNGGGGIGGGILGGIFGAVIRGGTAGDDHCDPRTDGRYPRGHGVGGDVYRPNGTGGMIGTGGMAGGRMPRGRP